jgi:hypothetical protein
MVGLASGLCLIKTAHYQAGNAVYDSVLNRVPETVHLLAKAPAPPWPALWLPFCYRAGTRFVPASMLVSTN